MRASVALSVVAILTLGATAAAQSTASFPQSEPTPPVPPPPPSAPAAPAAPAVQPAWSGAAMTAPATAPVTGPSWSWGAPESAPPPQRDQAPAGYELEEHTPAGPIVVGSLLLAVPYATGLGIAAAEGFANGSGWLAVPALGPWLALAGRDNPCDSAKDAQEFNSDVGNCVAEPFVRGMLVLDGVLQATGAVVLLVGASGTEKRWVPRRAGSARVVAMPTPVGRDGYGLGLLGSF